MVLSAVLLNALEDGVNRLLRMDPDAELYLLPLVGKIIAIRIKYLEWTIYCCPHANGIQFLERFDGNPDTVIIGSPSALALMGLSDSPWSFLAKGEVVIEGDANTGKELQTFIARLDHDPEEFLSHYTGDVIAHQVGNFVRSGRKWSQALVKTLELDITEFFQHETRDLLTRSETDHFFEEVDNLRASHDRLEARIQRLQATLHQL